MIFGIFLLVIIAVIWFLFVEGWFWKLILAFFGWIGMYLACQNYPDLKNFGITVFDTNISWSIIIPSVIVLLAMAYTKVE